MKLPNMHQVKLAIADMEEPSEIVAALERCKAWLRTLGQTLRGVEEERVYRLVRDVDYMQEGAELEAERRLLNNLRHNPR